MPLRYLGVAGNQKLNVFFAVSSTIYFFVVQFIPGVLVS
jgi:hypothetical protein